MLIIVKKSTLKDIGIFVGFLVLISGLMFVVDPEVFVSAADVICEDGVCDFYYENSNLDMEGYRYIDNGVEDPGESYRCKGVIFGGGNLRISLWRVDRCGWQMTAPASGASAVAVWEVSSLLVTVTTLSMLPSLSGVISSAESPLLSRSSCCTAYVPV